MKNKIRWNLIDEGNKTVRIQLDEFSKIPTIAEYKRYIGNLLGIYNKREINSLINENNGIDLADSLLLHAELSKNAGPKYKGVIFSGSNGDVLVTEENFEKVFKVEKNADAIKDVLFELYEENLCR